MILLGLGLLLIQTHETTFVPNPANLHSAISQKDLKTHVRFLSSKALAGRLTGSDGERQAQAYVAAVFQHLGIPAFDDKGGYFQRFNYSSAISLHLSKTVSDPKAYLATNVLARLELHPKARQFIVIGAHVDHLGRGEFLGFSPTKGVHYPGADDNASGVATVLEVAKQLHYLRQQGRLQGDKDIIFAIWSGEEFGVLGSSHFLKQYMSNHKQQLVAYINLDMVGRLQDKLILQGVGSSAHWSRLISQVATQVPVVSQSDPYLPTDSTSFYLQKIPAINIFTGAHEDYHTPRDLPETLNYQGMQTIAAFLVNLVQLLENDQQAISYQEVTKTPQQLGKGLRAYLGTIPDYASMDVKGVKIAGVAKGSPAARAGLQKDDIIIGLAGNPISNIYEYTDALNHLHVGEPTQVIVQRGVDRVSLSIIAWYRH